MLARLVINLVLLDLFAESGTGTNTVITQDVQSKNVSMGAPKVGFVCEVSEANSCNWMVNGNLSANHITVVTELNIINYVVQDVDVNTNTEITCVMMVPTGPDVLLLNGTRVQCLPLVAIGDFGGTTAALNGSVPLKGSTAKMLLQGQYASVGDIYFSNESFSIEAKWNRPYHLAGVPPTEYNCTVSTLSTKEVLNTTVDHENTSCSFMLEEDMICDVLVIDVVAYNQWIGGDTETVYWSLGGLSTAHIVGLAIGAVAFLVLLLVGIIGFVFLLLKYKMPCKKDALSGEDDTDGPIANSGSSKTSEIWHVHVVHGGVTVCAVIAVIALMGALLYVVFDPVSECAPAGNATLEGKSLQKRIQESHKVIADGSPFQKQSHDDHLQEYSQQCCHYGNHRVMIFHHQNKEDKDELLSFMQGRYQQMPSKGCAGNVTQWTNVKPKQEPDNEV